MAALSGSEAKRQILLILESGFVEPTYHCRQDSMVRRGVTTPQLVHALRTGEIRQQPEWDELHQNWKYRVEGEDTDGDELVAITVILEDIAA